MRAFYGSNRSILVIVAVTAKAGIESWKIQRKNVFETDSFLNVRLVTNINESQLK